MESVSRRQARLRLVRMALRDDWAWWPGPEWQPAPLSDAERAELRRQSMERSRRRIARQQARAALRRARLAAPG